MNPTDAIDFATDWLYQPVHIVQLPDGRKRVVLSAMTKVGNIVQGLDPEFCLELAEAMKKVALEAGAKPKSGLVYASEMPRGVVGR